jgi:hypothetical protein
LICQGPVVRVLLPLAGRVSGGEDYGEDDDSAFGVGAVLA